MWGSIQALMKGDKGEAAKEGDLSAGEAADVALQRPDIARAKLVGRQLSEPVHERLPLLCRQLGGARTQLRH